MLGAGLLGSFGRILEKYARMSIAALEHFAKLDAHAAQYAMISRSLLSTAVEYLEKKETQERLQRTESSAQLFGLLPSGLRGDMLPSESSHSGFHHSRRSPEFARKMMASPPKSGTPGLGTGNALTEKRESIAQGSEPNNNHNNNNSHHHGGTGIETGSSHPSAGFTPGMMGMGSPLFSDLDPAFLTMSNSLPRTPDLSLMNSMFDGEETSFGGLNLFPLLDGTGGGGHIDLAHYL